MRNIKNTPPWFKKMKKKQEDKNEEVLILKKEKKWYEKKDEGISRHAVQHTDTTHKQKTTYCFFAASVSAFFAAIFFLRAMRCFLWVFM